MFYVLSARPLDNSFGLSASCMEIDCADPIQRPKDARQFRVDQSQRNWSKVIAVLRVEGCVTLQPSVAIGDDDFCVWVWRQRLYYLVPRESDQSFHEKLAVFLRRPERNDIPALVPPLDHDRPAIKDSNVPRARQIRIERWLSCMLFPVTARIVHPTCVKTVMVGSQKSADCTRRTRGCLEETFFQ